MTSSSAPPSSVSAPGPPSSRSAPFPPSTRSMPRTVSPSLVVPAARSTVTGSRRSAKLSVSPGPPSIRSAPGPPKNVSLSSPPVSVSAPSPPSRLVLTPSPPAMARVSSPSPSRAEKAGVPSSCDAAVQVAVWASTERQSSRAVTGAAGSASVHSIARAAHRQPVRLSARGEVDHDRHGMAAVVLVAGDVAPAGVDDHHLRRRGVRRGGERQEQPGEEGEPQPPTSPARRSTASSRPTVPRSPSPWRRSDTARSSASRSPTTSM